MLGMALAIEEVKKSIKVGNRHKGEKIVGKYSHYFLTQGKHYKNTYRYDELIGIKSGK